ncbi:unnamed protein product [Mytilus edulis]|uniref:Uncharacterized protein n=1 Tax=Mytilus edulis TaxID=6550 RepID=A0A8S3TUP0_MYTED|nr:unnamed protein product [Mytilus edulis]
MLAFLCLGFLTVSQALFLENFKLPSDSPPVCLMCCGPSPCCNTCGLGNDLLSLLKPVVGTQVNGKEVVSAKRFLVDDLFHEQNPGACLDCCGTHPCCHDCGLGDLFGNHHHTLMPYTTVEPHSPEKDESYGDKDPLSGLSGIHFPHIDPVIDPIFGHPDTDVAKSYWETLGKK